MIRRILLLILLLVGLTVLLLTILISTFNASADTITVDVGGGKDYENIQDALDAANPGDTVFVYPGTYYGNLEVNKSINLIGQDRNSTMIYGDGNKPRVQITSDWVNISGFTVTGYGPLSPPSGDKKYGISIISSHVTINKTNITGNSRGVYAYNSSSEIKYINITNNIIAFNDNGIEMQSSNYCVISNNTILNNYGVLMWYFYNSTVSNNVLKHNEYGLNLHYSNNNLFSNNFISESIRHGLFIEDSNENVFSNTITTRNLYHGIFISSSDNNRFQNLRVSNNSRDGIFITYGSDNNLIINNIISTNGYSNDGYGIYIEDWSDNNAIYHNNLIKNANQAYDDRTNQWDNGYPSGGNFWSDYTGHDDFSGPGQNLSDSDGIGDAPYIIDSDSQDNYPLMEWFGLNYKPNASFTFTPSSGSTSTVFYFDASPCSDIEDRALDLKVRWDWEDDGIWDTEWTATKTASHRYLSLGTYTVRLEALDSGGKIDNISQQIVIQQDIGSDGLKTEVVIGGATVITAVLSALVLGATDVGKNGLFLLFLPLYTRLNKGEVINHETRGRIRGMVESDPGIRYNELKKKLKLKNGALSYHLQVLEREGFIKSKNNGIYKHFFSGEMKLPKKIIRMTDIQKIIIKKIIENSGISQKKIAKLIGIGTSTTNYNVNIMAKKGIIELKRKGNETECYIIEED